MIRLTIQVYRRLKLLPANRSSTLVDKEFFLGLAKHKMEITSKKELNYEDFINAVNLESIEKSNSDEDVEANDISEKSEDLELKELSINAIYNSKDNLIESDINLKCIEGDNTSTIVNPFKLKKSSPTFNDRNGRTNQPDNNLTSDASTVSYIKGKNNQMKEDLSNIESKFKLSGRIINTSENFPENVKLPIGDIANLNKDGSLRIKNERDFNESKLLRNSQSDIPLNPANASTDKTIINAQNKKETLFNFLKLGVDLFRAETPVNERDLLLGLNWETDVVPLISILKNRANLKNNEVAELLSKNFRLFKSRLVEIEKTLDVLSERDLSPDDIGSILRVKAGLLCIRSHILSKNLYRLQKSLSLTTKQLNSILCLHPKILVSHVNKIEMILSYLQDSLGYSKEEIREIVLKAPRILIRQTEVIGVNHVFLNRHLKLSHEDIVKCPLALIVTPSVLKDRVGFLKYKHQFELDLPTKNCCEIISQLIEGSDGDFCRNVAQTSSREFEKYLSSKG